VTQVQPLFGARQLAAWVRSGGRPARRINAYFSRLWWHSCWFELNWSTQARTFAQQQLPADPVFVVGLWRSGTTACHDLMTAATGWYTPRTWQCFNPSTCFLTGAPQQDAAIERPMDRGVISGLGPQEDEFAALLLGEPSIYRGFIDPRRLTEAADSLWSHSASPLTRWQDFLRGLAREAAGLRLLLKSPSHTFRLPFLRSLFPQARFIWVGRDIGTVLASNVRMWRAMTERYGLWECPHGAIETMLQRMLGPCERVLTYLLDELSPEQLLWIDYEDLQADRRAALARALAFVGALSTDCHRELDGRLDAALAQVPLHPGTGGSAVGMTGLAEIRRLMAAVRERFAG
jgi:omega-hydroxy-beta-dihydromenaquinone-9 sulfotransferase